jgi:hypothetical protein
LAIAASMAMSRIGSMRATIGRCERAPFRLVAYLDPRLRAATSPGRVEKLGAACGGNGDDDQGAK